MGASVFLRGIDSRHLKDGPDGTGTIKLTYINLGDN